MGDEGVAISLESAGTEVPVDDADCEQVFELDSMERLFFFAFAALASPGVWLADSDAVASAVVEALDVLVTGGGMGGVGR